MSWLTHGGAGISPAKFQRLLKERTLEKKQNVEAKRQKDSQRIRERKSKEGIHPLDQFPIEIWDVILKELVPSDRGKMWELHPLFQEIMVTTRIRDILFPQIVSMKVPEFWKKESQKRGHRCCHVLMKEKRSPLARHLLLRKVSKSLRDAIDNWHEDNILKIMRMRDTDTDDDDSRIHCLSLSLFDKELLENVVKNFSEGDPRFFLRALKITIPEQLPPHENRLDFASNLNQFSTNVTTLLDQIGDQILYFHYSVPNITILDEGRVRRSEIYLKMQGWLTQMTNLKWLKLDIESWSTQISKSSGRRMRQAIQNHPFPKLEKLERICITLNDDCHEGFDVFEAALESNKHVSILSIDGDPDAFQRLPSESVRSLTQVKSLTLNYGCGYLELPAVEQMMNLQWPLKQLEFYVNIDNISIRTLFEFLEKFPSLEDLSIDLDSLTIKNDDDMAFLKLPNLTHLNFDFQSILDFKANIHFFFSLQFLIECKKLKTLSWDHRPPEAFRLKRYLRNHECHERMINFRGGFRDLRFANIWNVFPYLEHVVAFSDESAFEDGKYRRSDRLD